MAEKEGRIVSYNPVNRLGEIVPKEGGQSARFYLHQVTNGEVAPKRNDVCLYEAPDPRKNKQGKIVQGNATSVTVTERAPDVPQRPERGEQRPRGRDPRRMAHGRRERGGDSREGRGRSFGGRRERRNDARAEKTERPRHEAPARDSAPATVVRERRGAPRTVRRSDRAARNLSRAISAAAAVAFPLPSSYSSEALLAVGVNPALLQDKLVGWPLSKKSGAQSEVMEWRFKGRNKLYFLEHTLVPAVRHRGQQRSERNWIAERTRRLVRGYAADGYQIYERRFVATSPCAPQLNRAAVAGGSGVSLHALYGCPMIGAGALKGVARHWAEACGVNNGALTREELQEIFGERERRGAVVFMDALAINGRGRLVMENLSCHYPEWYRGGESFLDCCEPEIVPTCAFGQGMEFQIVLVLRAGADKALLDRAAMCLERALDETGVGARAGVGFGLLRPVALREAPAAG